MTINWDQVPVEMRQSVVKELDVGTRVNLSMCSKSENQLVRSTKYGKLDEIIFNSYAFEITFDHKRENKDRLRVLVKPREDGGSKVYVHHHRWPGMDAFQKYSTANDWKETIVNIMSLIGTSVKVEYLELETGRNFKEMFKWLRNKVHFNPYAVHISLDSFTDHYDESIWDWPSHTRIDLCVHCCKPSIHLTAVRCRLPNFERINIYDRISSYAYHGDSQEHDDNMTDEELKKFRNADHVFLDYSDVTINGFIWWFKEWITRMNDEAVVFVMIFKRGQEISFQTLSNALSGFIERIERCSGGDRGPAEDYWKIYIKNEVKAGAAFKYKIHLYKYKMNFRRKLSTA